jgi:hypothetical protein
MHKSLIAVLLLSLLIFADGFFYSAHAQCTDTDKIYIDPRLVPKRGNMTPEQLNAIMHSPGITPEARNYLLGQYMQKPIEVPYGTGRVLVHPTNPCIQQYIP